MQAITTLAFCWRIERPDGAGLALTSHDQDLLHEGISYRASPGLVPAAITKSLGLEPASGEIAGALRMQAITENDLSLGRWDGAKVELFAVQWDGVAERIALVAGELGEVATHGESFSAELRGAARRLAGPVCPTTSPECRAEFGDKRCRVDLAGRTVTAQVMSINGGELELDRALDDNFAFGRLRYRSGANCGASTVILSVAGGRVRVRDLPRADVEPGCRVEIREGCDKRLETCAGRFANAVNFRGEPHLPGNDLLTRYPGT